MLRPRRILEALCASAVTCGLLAGVPGAATADIVASGTPTIASGLGGAAASTVQVGQTLYCDSSHVSFSDPSADGTVEPGGYNWYHVGSGTPIASSSPYPNSYTPTASDIGFQLVCNVSGTEYGGSNSTTTSSNSAATAAVAPEPAITITQYSPRLSGNLGNSVSGVGVTLTLSRPNSDGTITTVATGTATTASTGAWSATLSPTVAGPNDAFGAPADRLTVHYSGGGTLPPDFTYSSGFYYSDSQPVSFLGGLSTISPDGHTVAAPAQFPPCAGESFVVDGGAPQATTQDTNDCVLTASSALTDANHVQARLTYTYTSTPGSEISSLTTLSDVGLRGVGSSEAFGAGAPTCSVDLVSGQVTCKDLSAGSFTVSDNGASAALSSQPTSSGQNGYVGTYQGTAFLPPARAGDVITLDETAPTATSRHITALNVYPLRVDISPTGSISGDCQAGKSGPGYGNTPFESLCTPSGKFSAADYYGGGEFDDLSGGSTTTNVPTLGNLIPTADDSVAGGTFTAYGDLLGTGSTGQVLGQVASVNLQIVARGSTVPAYNQSATLGSDGVGPFETANVSGLSDGLYSANWKLTDTHGDTYSVQSPFAVQPGGGGSVGQQGSVGPQGPAGATGATGAQGPAGLTGAAGPQGPRGPEGPAGQSSKCVVTNQTVGKGKSKHTVQHITCSVISSARDVMSVMVSRGGTTYAVGRSAVNRGRVQLRLRSLRNLKHGRYLVTIVVTRGKHAQVIRFTTKL